MKYFLLANSIFSQATSDNYPVGPAHIVNPIRPVGPVKPIGPIKPITPVMCPMVSRICPLTSLTTTQCPCSGPIIERA